MLHPLISTLVQRPDLVMDHVSAYAALFHEEVSEAGKELLERAIAWMLAVISALLFLGLTGVAVMLGSVQEQFHWALVLVPGVMLVIGIGAVVWARKPLKAERFPELRAQIGSDAQALRMAA